MLSLSRIILPAGYSEVYKKGMKISAGDIKKGDVLSIAGAELDDNVLNSGTVYVTDSKVTGKVTSIDYDEMTVCIESDGTENEYKYYNGVNEKYLEPGAEGIYYLCINGRIIYLKGNNSSYNYGFATLITLDMRGGEVNGGSVRVYGTDGVWRTLDLNTTVNGSKLSSIYVPYDGSTVNILNIGKDLYVAAKDSRSADIVVNDMIAYKTNTEGLIKTIAAGQSAIMSLTESDTANMFDKKYYNGDYAGYYVTDDTKIFALSSEIPPRYDIDESRIALLEKKDLISGANYSFSLYGINDDNEIGIMLGLIYPSVNYESDMFIVSSVGMSLIDDEYYYTLKGMQGGETVRLFASDDSDVTEFYEADLSGAFVTDGSYLDIRYIEKGDILYVNKNAKNIVKLGTRMTNILKMRDATAAVSSAVTNGIDEGGFISGYVLGVKNNKVYLGKNPGYGDFDIDNPGSANYISVFDNTKVTFFDSMRRKPYKGTVSDIDTEDAYVFARLNDIGKVTEIVVY